MNRKGFTLMELLVVMAILGVLIVAGIGNFMTSQKKSRDIKRKNDLRQISLALETYYNDLGSYPLSSGTHTPSGCGASATSACTWGDVWKNTTTDTIYMITLPADPISTNSYYYVSDGSYFKLYARLENTLDTGTGVAQSGYAGTVCADATLCTYGISSPNSVP